MQCSVNHCEEDATVYEDGFVYCAYHNILILKYIKLGWENIMELLRA